MGNEIRLFILGNGFEIIGKVTEETEDSLTLQQARSIQMHMTAPGQASVAIVPFSAGNPDGEYTFDKEHIAAVSVGVPKELEDGYLQQTTGITIAQGL